MKDMTAKKACYGFGDMDCLSICSSALMFDFLFRHTGKFSLFNCANEKLGDEICRQCLTS